MLKVGGYMRKMFKRENKHLLLFTMLDWRTIINGFVITTLMHITYYYYFD